MFCQRGTFGSQKTTYGSQLSLSGPRGQSQVTGLVVYAFTQGAIQLALPVTFQTECAMLGILFKCIVQACLDGNHYVGQAGLELTGICLPQPPEDKNNRH